MVYLRTSERKYIEEEANKLRLQKKRVRKIRIIASGLAIIALLSIGYMFFAIERSEEADRHGKILPRSLMIQAVRDKERADSSSFVAMEQRDMADSTARLASQKAEEAYVRVKIYEDRNQKAERDAAEAINCRTWHLTIRFGKTGNFACR